MATAISKLEKKVEESLKAQFGEVTAMSTPDDAVKIGWQILIGPIVDVILNALSGCLGKFSREEVTGRIAKPNAWTRLAIRDAVNRSESIEPEMRKAARKTVLDVVTDSTKEEADELIKEFNQEPINWDLYQDWNLYQ